MTTPPTTILDWANSADPSDVEQPTTQVEDSGWLGGMIPPNAWTNWIWKNLYDWLAHFKAGVTKYTDLEDAIDGTAAGETFILDEYSAVMYPGKVYGEWDKSWSVDPVSVDVWGKGVLVAFGGVPSPGNLLAYERNMVTLVANYTKTNTGAIKRAVTDGTYVVACYGDYVECWDMDGTQRWLYDHGAAVHDVCLDGVNAYFVGAKGTGNMWARAITLSDTGTPTPVWSYAHGTATEVLYCCATNGAQLFLAGDARVGGSGATIRGINAENGKDFANEGGNGIDTAYLSWDRVQSTECDQTGQLATDGSRLFVGYPATTNELEVRGCIQGEISVARSTTAVSWVSCDDRFVYAVTSSATVGTVRAFTKADLVEVWNWYNRDGSTNYDIFAAASDGARVFCAIKNTPDQDIVSLYGGQRPKLWRRHASTEQFLPYRQLAIPEE